MTTETTKQCPYCAETIQAAAIVCRFCNRDLVQMPAAAAAAIDRQLVQEEIGTYTKQGWRIASQTETSFQAIKPKEWSALGVLLLVFLPAIAGCLYTPLFGIAIIGLVIVAADYLMKKDETKYVTAADIRRARGLDIKPANSNVAGPPLFRDGG